MLRIAQEMDVGLPPPIENLAAAAQKTLERTVGSLMAEVAGDGRPPVIRDTGRHRDVAPLHDLFPQAGEGVAVARAPGVAAGDGEDAPDEPLVPTNDGAADEGGQDRHNEIQDQM